MSKLFLATILLISASSIHAQFPKAVKDSVLAQLQYPTNGYNLSLCVQPQDYSTTPPDELYSLSKEQLKARLNNNNRDAGIYSALFSKAYFGEKNAAEAGPYIDSAFARYEKWINEEPNNPLPVEQFLALCNTTAHKVTPMVLDYALARFPTNILVLQHATYYHQYTNRNYDKSQQYISEALKLDSMNIRSLIDQVTLYYARFSGNMQGTPSFSEIQIPALNAAMRAQPNNVAYQHIDHYRMLSELYLKCVSRYLASGTDDVRVFNHCKLTDDETKQVKKIAGWLTQQAAKKESNEAVLLNSLGVTACLQQDYEKAHEYFSRAAIKPNVCNAGESVMLTLLFMKKYPELEKALKEKIVKNQHPLDYGSLLKVYRKYSIDTTREKNLLNELKALNITHPNKDQVLATGYLLTGQPSLSRELLPQLSDDTVTNLLIKTTAAVMADNRESAAQYLQKAEQLSPGNKDVLKIKALTGL